MLGLGPLAFAAPWLLAALAVLPVLWWLLRVMPPAPRFVPFPAIRLLFGLPRTDEAPHRTPWWLLALRLLLAALVIVALARPLLNPDAVLRAGGPLLLVIDNGWAAARDWPAHEAVMRELIDEADRAGRAVVVLPTAPGTDGRVAASGLMPAGEARRLVRGLVPHPWPVDRAATRAALDGLALDGSVNAVWLADGLAAPSGIATDTDLAEALQTLGRLRVIAPAAATLPVIMAGPDVRPDALLINARRPRAGLAQTVRIDATADDGRLLARQTVTFAADATAANAALELPIELRNRVGRLALGDEPTAAAVVLLDERFRRRPVGIAAGDTVDVAQPLLGDAYYLERALEPFAEVRTGGIDALLARELAILVIADIGTLTDEQVARVDDWIKRGGVAVRFAGIRLADGGDDLLPVRLRRGGRIFGGVMSWQQPARLAAFDGKSPFAGLTVSDDVVVRRQVLAEPSPDLGAKTWARLSDGTPLVTAEARGTGWLVLFHSTANTEWSSLALSGTYVDMLRRLITLSQGVAGADGDRPLPPFQTLDGFGRRTVPPNHARPIAADAFAETAIGPQAPPGFYGDETSRRALNLGVRLESLAALGELPAGVELAFYGPPQQVDLTPWLLVAALVLLLADFVLSLGLRGLLPWRSAATAAAVLLAVGGLAAVDAGSPAFAQSSDAFATDVTDTTRLAYVLTGDGRVDEISRAGLVGLGLALARRTSVEPGTPVGLDIRRDELAFFPLLYWPMTEGQEPLAGIDRAKINDYLRHGGTILFDTRDQQFSGIGGTTAGNRKLRQLVAGLDLPPLVPVPPGHVLTKSFYLMQEFPGRWAGGPLWVQQPDSRINDGVSPVIIGGNDYAAAWAIERPGQPMFAVVPGGNRQREMAYRFGINLVMYALTGNYKADQVHVPAILERLGQ